MLEIDPARFSHGGTRNLLMNEASGAHVALLTQDAEPADPCWLERLLGGFELARDVGIVYGPYLPRPDATPAVRLELERWFTSLAPDGAPRVDRLDEHELARGPGASLSSTGPAAGVGEESTLHGGLPVAALIGARGFFTDANACLARAAWQRAPFREVPYAEDRVLAIDMLRAGFAKAFVPSAGGVALSRLHTPRGAASLLRRVACPARGLRLARARLTGPPRPEAAR